MTNTSKTIVFFGTDDFSAANLRRLISEGFSVAAVVTKPDSKKGRGQTLQAPLVKQIALEHNITVLQPTRLLDIADELAAIESPLGVLVSYGKIIPQSIIDLFTPGIINVHPSLLPKYRGPSPIESAILNGDTETGITIMQLSAAMDAGPLYHQVAIPLSGSETTPELEISFAERGADELVAVLPAIIDGSLQPAPQDDSTATYCQLLQKSDAWLDTASLTAAAAEQRVRAYLAFPKTKVTIAGHDIVITKAHVESDSLSILDLPCHDGAFLRIDSLIGPSGKQMAAADFLNGYAA